MKKLLALLMMFGLLTFTAGCPDKDAKDAKKDAPKKDEPKKDSPKKDDAKKDEPKKDSPKKDDPKPEDVNVKVEKSDVEIAPDAKMTIPVTAGKATKVEVEPADSKVKATIDDGKVTIDAKEAKDGDKATVKVTGTKGTADIKVTIKK